jgi:hypothetical protein
MCNEQKTTHVCIILKHPTQHKHLSISLPNIWGVGLHRFAKMSLILPSSWSPVEPEREDQCPFQTILTGARLHELELRGKHCTHGAASHGGDMWIGSLMHACSIIEVRESVKAQPIHLMDWSRSLFPLVSFVHCFVACSSNGTPSDPF